MKKLALLFLVAMWIKTHAQEARPVILQPEHSWQQLPYKIEGPEIRIFEDKTDQKTIADITVLPDSAFKALQYGCCNFGTERHRLWLKFRLINHTPTNNALVELVNPFITKVILFQTDTMQQWIKSDTTGTSYPFDQRPIKHRNFLFPIQIKQGASQWIYCSFEPDYPLQLSILVWPEHTRFGTQQRAEDILLTFFFTFCALYLALSTMLIVQSKQYYIWPYFIYVILTTAFIPAYLGLGYRYIWPVAPYLQFIIPATLNCLRLVFGILFFQNFFDIRHRSKLFHHFLQISIAVFLLTAVMIILHKWTSLAAMRAVLNIFFGYLMFFSLAMTSWAFYQIFFKKRRNLFWALFIIGIHFFVQGTTALQFLGYGSHDPIVDILPFGIRTNTFFAQTSLLAGFLIEMFAVFYFIAKRFFRLLEAQNIIQKRISELRENSVNNMLIGVENERKRIASDLHDGACVHIAAIKMNLEAYMEQVEHDISRQKINEIVQDLDTTYREVRDMSHHLMSKALEKTDLVTALEEHIDRIRRLKPALQIQFYTNIHPYQINHIAKVQIYRIVQELLANIVQHAKASNADIQLLYLDKKLLLTVADDGIGYNSDEEQNGGIGLSTLRLRVSVLKGELRIESSPRHGTFSSIEIPEIAIQNPDSPT